MCSMLSCRWSSVDVKGERGTVLAKYRVLAAGFVLFQVQGIFGLETILSWTEWRSECISATATGTWVIWWGQLMTHVSRRPVRAFCVILEEGWCMWVSIQWKLFASRTVMGWYNLTVKSCTSMQNKMFYLGRSVYTLNPSLFCTY